MSPRFQDALTSIIQITDIHFNADFPNVLNNWNAIVEFVEQEDPDLVLITGDIVEAPDSEQSYLLAKQQLARLRAPWLAVPGDHDVGSPPPVPTRFRPERITNERIRRYRLHIGEDHWVRDIEGWRIIGLNSNLFGSGLADEAHQWGWLNDQLSTADERQIAFAWHRPPCDRTFTETEPTSTTIHPNAREHLKRLIAHHRIQLIICGHLHQYMTVQCNGISVVVGPSLVMHRQFTPDSKFPEGIRVSGCVQYTFARDHFSHILRQPDGVGLVEPAPLHPDPPSSPARTKAQKTEEQDTRTCES